MGSIGYLKVKAQGRGVLNGYYYPIAHFSLDMNHTTNTIQGTSVLFGLFLMFSNFYQLDLHNQKFISKSTMKHLQKLD